MPYYTITNYTRRQARRLGVKVKHSTNKTKKIDVYKKNKKIASVGAAGMSDYPTHMKLKGKQFADKRRRLYKMRHERERHKKWTRGWLSDQLLW
jgi:hypothetical protein